MRKTWTKKYDCCVVCGTKEHSHYGRGMCSKCYNKAHYKGRIEPKKQAPKADVKVSTLPDIKVDISSVLLGSTEPDIKVDIPQDTEGKFYELVARWMNVSGAMRRVRAKVLKVCSLKDAVGTLFYAVMPTNEPKRTEYWPTNECEKIGYWR